MEWVGSIRISNRIRMVLLMAKYPITEQSLTAQQYQVTLDGDLYLATIGWLAFGQRLYIAITDSFGNIILNLPLISSDHSLNLLAGYFTTSKLTYNSDDGIMEVVP